MQKSVFGFLIKQGLEHIEEMKQQRGDGSEIAPLKVEFESCPVQASLGTLGRKWALLILRNIALFDKHRFNEMLKVRLQLSTA
ncbi:MAG: hypothetical protein JRN15_07060 [Nitrososphaerota archaeon]|nr:hypothetical protein [Nitrososphaerota archaeon]